MEPPFGTKHAWVNAHGTSVLGYTQSSLRVSHCIFPQPLKSCPDTKQERSATLKSCRTPQLGINPRGLNSAATLAEDKDGLRPPVIDPGTPGFPVKLGGVGELLAAFSKESRIRGRVWCSVEGNPGIAAPSAAPKPGAPIEDRWPGLHLLRWLVATAKIL